MPTRDKQAIIADMKALFEEMYQLAKDDAISAIVGAAQKSSAIYEEKPITKFHKKAVKPNFRDGSTMGATYKFIKENQGLKSGDIIKALADQSEEKAVRTALHRLFHVKGYVEKREGRWY